MKKQLFSLEDLIGKTITKVYTRAAQLMLVAEDEFIAVISEETSYGSGLFVFDKDYLTEEPFVSIEYRLATEDEIEKAEDEKKRIEYEEIEQLKKLKAKYPTT
jgi:hypothetical protein